ncbi:MAG: ATP-grasp domain-containing protein, partial [Actinomycetota bacterium]|nr:ATP-grasp domain-containing protein [Actinomycetota bacterium]
MPRRDDISSILIIGSGPIVIGQAAEFDYSGTQACRALRDEGYRVILVNSNPATIMTDPEVAEATYIEPLTVETVAEIIRRERPDALLPTLGGQTALNLSIELHDSGVLAEFGVELLGASVESIHKAEDRQLFHEAMGRIGLRVPESRTVRGLAAAEELAERIGFPLIIRPSFTLGGKGGSVARDRSELRRSVADGLDASPVGSVLVERSIAGWKEFELEVMRDVADNCVVICSIENVDPMGVHT